MSKTKITARPTTVSVSAVTPAFTGLHFDITKILIPKMTVPSLSSLARTNKEWHQYLTQDHQLPKKLFQFALDEIKTSSQPVLRAFNYAERLGKCGSIVQVDRLIERARKSVTLPSKEMFSTLLYPKLQPYHPKLSRPFTFKSTPDKLTSLKRRECEHIAQFLESVVKGKVKYSHEDSSIRKLPRAEVAEQIFERCLKVIKGFPDLPRCYAFLKLVELLIEHAQFGDEDSAFWKDKHGRGSTFKKHVYELLPDSLLGCIYYKDNWLLKRFLGAAKACLGQKPGNDKTFRKLLLTLAIVMINRLPKEYRKWKKAGKWIDNESGYMPPGEFSRQLINMLLTVGEVAPDFIEDCKTRLVGCGFLREGEGNLLDQRPLPFGEPG